MGMFDWVGDGVKWLNDRVDDVEDWASDVWHGDTGDQAVPAPELVRKVLASKGAQDWHQGADQATKLARQNDEMSARAQQLSAGLESAWTGGGADMARGKPSRSASSSPEGNCDASRHHRQNRGPRITRWKVTAGVDYAVPNV